LNAKVPYDYSEREKLTDLPFPLSEYEARIQNTRRLMQQHNLDALIAFSDQNDTGNLVYLANFEPMLGRGAVIVTGDSVSLVTDSTFHREPMHSLIWKTWIEDVTVTNLSTDELLSGINSKLPKPAGRIGVAGRYSFPVGGMQGQIQFVDREFLEMKSRKSDKEIEVMKESARIASCGMQSAVDSVTDGVEETEVAAAACQRMYEEGTSRLAFPPLVTSGPRAGVKHDLPTRRKIKNGEMVYIDIGAIWQGYYSDMSRTVMVGHGTKEQLNALDSILEIYNLLLKEVSPGVPAEQVARLGEKLAESKGWLSDYWSVGHGLGTTMWDIPILSTDSRDTFDSGMVFAYEPMIVRVGLGTAVVEDTILVRSSGACAITESERKLW
jgi:Xaa-Pro aminopeptidase